MSARRDGVYPTRHDEKRGWWICLPHRATHWAAYLRGKLVGRYAEKREADLNLRMARSRTQRFRPYGHGRRMEIPEWRA